MKMAPQEPRASDINNDLIIYRLDEIKSQLADFKKDYVTKEESAALKAEIADLRSDLHAIQNRNSLLAWLYPTASAAFGSLFTYLLIEYFRAKGGK